MSNNQERILFIVGSSRKAGNTITVMNHLCEQLEEELIDLSSHDIGYYDYDHDNQQDDFLPIAEKMTEASVIILATPVYWYSMSAQMKTFIDRWSDLVTIRKDLGRKLKDKQLALISCGSWEEAGEGFALPIQQTAKYMDMQFSGYFHTWLADNETFGNENVLKRVNLLQNSIENLIG
ncbi:MAG: NAD(P)H-dependent oxidoreductase [Roseivirga sp.]|nr:NAD(P)H-dependent oxidoreductase [Roseivirga sp.]